MPKNEIFAKFAKQLQADGMPLSAGVLYNNMHNQEFFDKVFETVTADGLQMDKQTFAKNLGLGTISSDYKTLGIDGKPNQLTTKTTQSPTIQTKSTVQPKPTAVIPNFNIPSIVKDIKTDERIINSPLPSATSIKTVPVKPSTFDVSKIEEKAKAQEQAFKGGYYPTEKEQPLIFEGKQYNTEIRPIEREELPKYDKLFVEDILGDNNNFTDKYNSTYLEKSDIEYQKNQANQSEYNEFNYKKSNYDRQFKALKEYESKLNQSISNKFNTSDILTDIQKENELLNSELSKLETLKNTNAPLLKTIESDIALLNNRYQNGQINENAYRAEFASLKAKYETIGQEINKKTSEIQEQQRQFQSKYSDKEVLDLLRVKQKQFEVAKESANIINDPKFAKIKEGEAKTNEAQKVADNKKKLEIQLQNKEIDFNKYATEVEKLDKAKNVQINTQAFIADKTWNLFSQILTLPRTISGNFENNYGFVDKVADWANHMSEIKQKQTPYSSDIQVNTFQKFAQVGDLRVLLDEKGNAYDVRDNRYFSIDQQQAEQALKQYNDNKKEYKVYNQTNADVFTKNALSTIADVGILILGTKGLGALAGGGKFASTLIGGGVAFTQVQNDLYKQGIESGLNPQDASQFATKVGTSISLISFINPTEYKLAGAGGLFPSIRQNVISQADVALINSGEMSISQIASKYAKGIAKNIVGENFEELIGEPLAQDLISNLYESRIANDGEGFTKQFDPISKQGLETLLLTSVVAIPFGAAEVTQEMPHYQAMAMQSAIENPQAYIDVLKKRKEMGIIDDAQMNAQLLQMQEISEVYNSISSEIKEERKPELAGLLAKKNVALNKIKEIKDDVLSNNWKAKLEKINEDIQAIVDNVSTKNNMVASDGIESDVVESDGVESKTKQKEPIKVFSDFDNTLFDPTTQTLTLLGEEMKLRIEAGEDIEIVTARENTKENIDLISGQLGIDPSKITLGLTPEMKAEKVGEFEGESQFIDDNTDNLQAVEGLGNDNVEVVPIVSKKQELFSRLSAQAKTTKEAKKIEKEQLAKSQEIPLNEKGEVDLPKIAADAIEVKTEVEKGSGGVGGDVDAKNKALEELVNLIPTTDLRRPNGSIGTQGFSPENLVEVARHIAKEMGFDIPAYDKNKGTSEIKQVIDYLKNNKEAQQKIRDYVVKDPVVVSLLPDNTYEIEDGNHRANLLNLIGVDVIPTIELNGRDKQTAINEHNSKVEAVEQSLKETPKAETQKTKAIITEIKSKNLTHVRGKGMGENQALGTFVSTEENNRYETPTQKAEKVDVEIENPLVVDDDYGLVGKRQEILNENRDKFTAEDSNDYQDLPNKKLTLDDLNDDGIKKLAILTTEALKAQGYDSIYFRESDTQEGELVVFDKKKVTFKENNIKLAENEKQQSEPGEKSINPISKDSVQKDTKKDETKTITKRKGTPKSRRQIRNPEYLKALSHEVLDVVDYVKQVIIGGATVQPIVIQQLFTTDRRNSNAGRDKSLAEKRSRIGILDKNGYPTISAFAHALWSNQVDKFGYEKFDTQQFENAIEEVISNFVGTRKLVDELNEMYDISDEKRYELERGSQGYSEYSDLVDETQYEQEDIDNAINMFENLSDEEIKRIESGSDAFLDRLVNDYLVAEYGEILNKEQNKPEEKKPSKNSPELISINKKIEEAEAEITKSNERLKDKIKELDKAITEDNADLFGNRKSEKVNLFEGSERVDLKQREKILEPFKNSVLKAKESLNKLKKKKQDIVDGKVESTGEIIFEEETKGEGDDRVLFSLSDDNQDPYTEVVNGFYSLLEKIINETKFDKLPAKQWIDKFAKGEEAKWTGLTDWLSQQQGSVSKSDIQNYLKDNRIEIVEVVKGGEQKVHFNIKAEKGKSVVYKNGVKDKEFDTYDKADDYVTNYKESEVDATKFSQYQIEGEKENYKEVLVTMPNRELSKKPNWNEKQVSLNLSSRGDYSETQKRWTATIDGEEATITELPEKGKYVLDYRGISNAQFDTFNEAEKYITDKQSQDRVKGKSDFKSSHFNEPNILVHLRMNTRTDSEGNKVLFLEEVQSDWGQKGKKEGFKSDEAYQKADDAYGKYLDRMKAKYGKDYDEYYTKEESDEEYTLLGNRDAAEKAAIPQAPFVTDTNAWTKLGLKVALKEAVKQGADKIAWSTGTQQFERWGSEEIHWRKNTTRTPQEEARIKELGEKIVNYKDTNEERVEHEKLARKEGGFSLLINEQTSGATAFNGQESGNKDDVTVQSKEDLRKAIKKNLSRERNDTEIDKLTERIWNRMQTEDSGTSLPRKEGMEGFYGVPSENKLGIVGNVAKSLFKQEPKTVEIEVGNSQVDLDTPPRVIKLKSGEYVVQTPFKDSYVMVDGEMENPTFKDLSSAKEFYINETNRYNKEIEKTKTSTQHSIDITPEMRAEVQGKGQPLFVLSNAKDQKPFETNDNTKATKENLTKTFPDAVVVQSESELPQTIQSEIKQQRAEGKVKGVFYNGKIYMVADNIKTIGEATGTYRHEKLGHKGVISYLKDKLDTYATRIIDNAKGEQLGKLKQLAKRYGFPIDLTKLTAKQKSDLGQEYIAMISENKSKYSKLWNDLVSFVREAIRMFGIKLSVTDTEIQSLIGKVEKIEKTNNDLSKSGKSQFQLSEDTSQKFDPKNKIHVEYSDMLNEYVDISIEEGVVPTLELLKSEIDEETFDELVSELGIPFIEGKFNTPFIQNLKLENLSKEQKDNPLVERAQITLGEDARQELDEIGRTYTADKWKEIEPQVDAFVQRVLGSRNFNESVLEIIQWMKDMPMSTYLNEDGIATAHTMILNKLSMHAYTIDKELFKEVFKFSKIRATSFGQAIAAYAEASTPESLFNNAIADLEIEKEEILNTVQPNGKTLKQELDLILEQISIKADEITEVLNAIDATTQNVANKTKGKTNKPSGSKPSGNKTKSNFVPRSKEAKEKAKVRIDNAKARMKAFWDKQNTIGFAYDPKADLKAHEEFISINKEFVLGFLEYGYSSILNIKEKLQAVLGKNANVDDFWHEVYDEEVRAKVKDLEKEQIVNAIVNAIKEPGDAKEVNAISQISRILAGVARNKGKSDKTTVPIEEKVRLLFENKDVASKAVEEALRIGIEQIKNNPKLSDAQKLERTTTLQDLASNFTVVPESVSRKAIQAGLKDIKETIESIAKKHYLDAEDAKQSLIDKLVLNAGLSHEDAKEYADILSNELDKQIGEKKAKLLDKLLNPKTKKAGNKKEIEKIIDAINLGALSSNEFSNLFAEKFGFRALTPQQVQFLQNTISIMFQQKGIMKRRIARTLADYIASLKPLDARNVGMLIQEIFYQHALGGINTVAMNIPIGSTLSVMANMLPVMIKNPMLFVKANLAYNRAGLGGTGIKAFIDTIQTGFNDVDNFVDEKNFLTSGSRYHKFLLSWGFKDPQNFITSVLYKLPMHIGYFASAFDNLINHRGGEILNYMHEYQSTDKSYLTIKEIHKQVEAKMGYNDAKNYSTIVNDEILDMKANGLTIPTGYKEQRVKELMVETRDRDIQQQAYRLIRSYGLMGKPDGISGAIYKAIAPAGIINDKDSNLTAVVKTIASITLLPFLRISFASMGMLASGIPVIGMGLGSYKLEKNEQTKRNEFSFKSAEELKQLAGIQVMTIGALIFGFMEMFDMEDDEKGNTVLSLNKNRSFDITGTNISFFDQDKMQLDKGNYLPLSIRFRKSDGTWGKLHEAGRYMPPIVAIMSILGNLRDKIEIQSLSKLDEEGEIKTTYANKEMVFESLMSIYGGLTVTSYNSLAQFTGKSADIIGYKNKSPQIQSDKKIEDTKKLLFNTIARPVKTLALPNIYRDATKNTEALLGSQKTMDSQYKNILKDFYGLDHLTNHKEVDIFGNKVMQTASFGEDDRYNLPEWKLLRERNITFDTPYFYKTAKFDGEKKSITNEQRLKLNDKASIAFGNYIRDNIEYLNGLTQIELIQEFDNYADQAKRDITSLDFNEAIK